MGSSLVRCKQQLMTARYPPPRALHPRPVRRHHRPSDSEMTSLGAPEVKMHNMPQKTTQRVWRETNLPPTPSSPSPTFSPPSSPKQRRQAELVAEQAAAVLAASLGSGSEQCGAEVFCDSDSDSNMHTQGVGLAPPDTYWGARTSDASVACSNFTTGNLSNSPVIAAMRKKRQL